MSSKITPMVLSNFTGQANVPVVSSQESGHFALGVTSLLVAIEGYLKGEQFCVISVS